MSPHVKYTAFLCSLAAIPLLSACGQSAGVPLGAQTSANAALMQPAKGKGSHGGGGIIYTAQLYGNEVQIYRQQGSQLNLEGTLSSGVSSPQGSVTTRSGWLYVANTGNEDVLVYGKKVKSGGYPTDILEDYGENPVNVDVDSSRNLVAVSNAGTSSQTGSVSVYVDRAAAPSRMLTYGSDILQGYGIALDKTGNCYWGVYDSTIGSGYIVEFPACSDPGSIVVPNVGDAGGLAFDQSGDLFYVDRSSSTPAIVACKHTSNCKTYKFNQLVKPINLNFNAHDKALWVADAAGYIDQFSVQPGSLKISFVMAYPVGSASNPPFGVAPNPGS